MDDSPPPRKTLERLELMLGLRFLTCSCYHNQQLCNDDWIKHEFVRALTRTREKHRFGLFAWVLMPEHFHLLIVPRLPESPVESLLNMLKSTMSRRVMVRWRATEAPIMRSLKDAEGVAHFWQPGGGHDRNVRGESERCQVVGYIHENPVKRGLVTKSTDWAWSSARWHAGDRTGTPIDSLQEYRLQEGERLVAQFGNLIEAARAIRSLNLGPDSTGHAEP